MALSQYLTLGRSGLRVSPLCLGTMTFGTEWGWGSEEADCGPILDAYLQAGGNFIFAPGCVCRWQRQGSPRHDRAIFADVKNLDSAVDIREIDSRAIGGKNQAGETQLGAAIRVKEARSGQRCFLGQVRRIICRARKPVADVINPSVKLLDDVLPCRGVARHTATDKGIDSLVVVQSALPKGVTPGPNPCTAKDLYEDAGPVVRPNRAAAATSFAQAVTRFRQNCNRAFGKSGHTDVGPFPPVYCELSYL